MERTTKEFKFVDVLDEIEMYCDPCLYIGDSWNTAQFNFEIVACERDANKHNVFSVIVSSDERNVNNIADATVFAECKTYFQHYTTAASMQTLIVSYNDDLTNFKGHKWHDTYSYELITASPLYGNKWGLAIKYEANEILDTDIVVGAFNREFKCPMSITMKLNHAELNMLQDMLRQNGFDVDIESIEE